MDKVITKSFDFLDKYKEWEVHEFFETCIISIYYTNKVYHYSVGDLFTGIIM